MDTPQSTENLDNRRVLVVDDNHDAADTLGMMLKYTGYESLCCYNGLQGVEAAESYKPMAIILDIGMPDITGYEACRRIREQPWGKEPLIIALTGYGSDEDRQKSRDAGFDAHLLKPVDQAELSALLRSKQA
jgi:CheY-like chemotaxis protein